MVASKSSPSSPSKQLDGLVGSKAMAGNAFIAFDMPLVVRTYVEGDEGDEGDDKNSARRENTPCFTDTRQRWRLPNRAEPVVSSVWLWIKGDGLMRRDDTSPCPESGLSPHRIDALTEAKPADRRLWNQLPRDWEGEKK